MTSPRLVFCVRSFAPSPKAFCSLSYNPSRIVSRPPIHPASGSDLILWLIPRLLALLARGKGKGIDSEIGGTKREQALALLRLALVSALAVLLFDLGYPS